MLNFFLYFKKPKQLFFYPEKPSNKTAIFKFCKLLNVKIISEDQIKNSNLIVISWEDTTFKKLQNYYSPHRFQYIINNKCNDISKSNIQKIFKEVFGYHLAINPLKYEGLCVEKSNLNAKHDGKIIECPILFKLENKVYEILVNNEVSIDMVEDIRVPIFRNLIPFVYIKNRKKNIRFKNENHVVWMEEVEKRFSKNEIRKIIHFSRRIHLDYGELDVLRDRYSGKIYIVDVNPTPYGPPNHLVDSDIPRAIKSMASAFKEAFLDSPHTLQLCWRSL